MAKVTTLGKNGLGIRCGFKREMKSGYKVRDEYHLEGNFSGQIL